MDGDGHAELLEVRLREVVVGEERAVDAERRPRRRVGVDEVRGLEERARHLGDAQGVELAAAGPAAAEARRAAPARGAAAAARERARDEVRGDAPRALRADGGGAPPAVRGAARARAARARPRDDGGAVAARAELLERERPRVPGPTITAL